MMTIFGFFAAYREVDARNTSLKNIRCVVFLKSVILQVYFNMTRRCSIV